jgi:hypothetical protein
MNPPSNGPKGGSPRDIISGLEAYVIGTVECSTVDHCRRPSVPFSVCSPGRVGGQKKEELGLDRRVASACLRKSCEPILLQLPQLDFASALPRLRSNSTPLTGELVEIHPVDSDSYISRPLLYSPSVESPNALVVWWALAFRSLAGSCGFCTSFRNVPRESSREDPFSGAFRRDFICSFSRSAFYI